MIGLAVLITTAVVATVAALVKATEIFLILFLAILFGIFLTHVSAFLSEKLSAKYKSCLGAVALLMVLLLAGGPYLFGSQIANQMSGTEKQLERAREKVQQIADQNSTVKSVLKSTPFLREIISKESKSSSNNGKSQSSKKQAAKSQKNVEEPEAESNPDQEKKQQTASAEQSAISKAARTAAAALSQIFKTTFGLLVNSVLIFFVGVFLATAPTTYRDGMVSLFPKARRDRVTEIMNKMGQSLWHWLVARFATMLVTGGGAGLLLFILGVPMAFTAGIVTGILTFVPNVGGLLSLILAMMLAIPEGTQTAQLTFAGYIALQLLESYVVTPLIEQKQVSIPPALLIAFQAIMGVLFGFLGAAVASPLLAASKTLVEEAYIKDVLGDDRQAKQSSKS